MANMMSLVCLLVLATVSHTLAKNYYVQKTTKLNWYAAFEACEAQGQQLATITSQSDENDLENALKAAGVQTQNIWTSGNDQAVQGQFVWFSTGQNVTYTKWSAGEPDNFLGNEHCIQLWNVPPGTISWNDFPCSTPMFYVCEDIVCNNGNNGGSGGNGGNCGGSNNGGNCGGSNNGGNCGGSNNGGLVGTLLNAVL